MKRDVIYINSNPNKPSYYTLEPIRNQQGEWDLPYVPKELLDNQSKELIKVIELEVDDIKAIDEMRIVLEKLLPILPSYLGGSETAENPCYRRIVDEVLAKYNKEEKL